MAKQRQLTSRQQRFVAEYLICVNATQAAETAGYSKKTARTQGSKLLTNVDIAQAVATGQGKQLKSADLTAVRILEELRRIGLSDMRSFFTEDGNLKKLNELTEDQGACLASFEVIKKNAEAGDGHTDVVHKFRVWDKLKALEMLAKHFALLTEKLEHLGEVSFKWQENE